ncbi:MAG: NADH-quinone oxidoreductase subunit C [Gammaproteobacteria bacterium]
MNATRRDQLVEALASHLDGRVEVTSEPHGEVTLEVSAEHLIDTCTMLRDHEAFRFEMLMDVAGVDYMGYGVNEWRGAGATATGFGRAVNRADVDAPAPGKRFAVVYHLLSIELNQRVRLRAYCPDDNYPRLSSVMSVWSGADWFEREAFDLFGILFDGHPDLRRLLTDYGFIGHPFRKDFPLSGNVEVTFDPDKGRVVYQPVSIAPRTLVPRIIRDDNRYDDELRGGRSDA